MATGKPRKKAVRIRTNEEVLTSLACNKAEAARLLGVGDETVTRLIDAKKLRAYRSGRRLKIIVRSLFEYQEREAG